MSDKLALLQKYAADARDLALQIDEREQALKDLKAKLKDLTTDTMPSLLDELKLDRIGVAKDGNKPAMDYKLIQQVSGAIAASWSEEKKQDAFDVLKKYKAESLIKTEVSAKLPKGSLKVAKQLVAAAKKLKITAEMKQTVHAGTLSSWLKEIYDGGQSLPQTDLEKIGGFIGRVVKAEERE